MASDLYLIRATQQWVKYTGVVALTLIDLDVQSPEFRDIFASSGTFWPAAASGASAYSGPGTLAQLDLDDSVAISPKFNITAGVQSDEVAHVALRQTVLKRTVYKFDIGATPVFLWAFVLDGDIIANNPPET